MPFAAILLRCLLALALVAGGVPAPGMASAIPVDDQASAMGSCHDLDSPDPVAADGKDDTDCCASADCLCDCLQHMPAAALAVPTVVTPVFPAPAPVRRSFERTSGITSSTLRPPIG